MTTLKITSSTKMSTAELQQRIDRLYDHLYANAPIRTPAGIAAEVGKILHTAMFIESRPRDLYQSLGTKQLPAFSFDRSQLKQLSKCSGSLCADIAREVRLSFSEMNADWKLYDPQAVIQLNDSDIAYCCAQLSDVLVSDRTRDVFGDALEIFRGQWAKRASGQFFTDQRVTALSMIFIGFDPRKGDDLVDLCAGTAGFLLAGLNYIHRLFEQEGQGISEGELVKIASTCLKGQEIDPDVCEIANATLSARLSNVRHPFVALADSLRVIGMESDNNSAIKFNHHLCAATNPPFGTKITIKDETVLKQFDLAIGANGLSNRAPDTLFLEQNIRILKPGYGRLAIVVPYQILSGPQTRFIREWIIRNAEVTAVIDLPADTFQPHTGTKAALLVLKKRAAPLANINEAENTSIFMSMPRWIGHDRRGNPVYKKALDGTPSDEILSDFDQVERAYYEFRAGKDPKSAHPQSFTICTFDILNDPLLRMNALFHQPARNRNLKQKGKKNTSAIEWKFVRIQDVVKDIFYPGRFKRNYIDHYAGAVPFLGGSNISQMIPTGDKWLHESDPHLEELQVHAGWILVTRSGSTGIVSTVPEAWDGYAMSEHVIRIVPDPQKMDPDYLHVFLRTQYAQDILAKGVFGSVIDEITPEFIGEINMPVPKSEKELASIIKKAKRARSARDTAISQLLEAVNDLNEAL